MYRLNHITVTWVLCCLIKEFYHISLPTRTTSAPGFFLLILSSLLGAGIPPRDNLGEAGGGGGAAGRGLHARRMDGERRYSEQTLTGANADGSSGRGRRGFLLRVVTLVPHCTVPTRSN